MKVRMKSWKLQAHKQGFFGAGQVSWNRSTLINTSCTTYESRAPKRKIFLFFLQDIVENCISSENLTHKCIQTGKFFPMLECFLSIFKKDRRNLSPSPFLVALQSWFIFLKEAHTALIFSSRQCPNSAKIHFRF